MQVEQKNSDEFDRDVLYPDSSTVSVDSDTDQLSVSSNLAEICDSDSPIEKFDCLVNQLNKVFASKYCCNSKLASIRQILQRVDLTTNEANKYTFFDFEKPYTRNLVATDGVNYTLLVLCWNSGMESKIHNHPCDGCFIKTLRGCIKETVYSMDEATGDIVPKGNKFYCEGQVSYMSDALGLHKIANPNKDVPAVTLHLYTPPFGSCKVWSDAGKGALDKFEEGKIGFFSVYGHRTPHLEGKPGVQSKLMSDIREAKQQ